MCIPIEPFLKLSMKKACLNQFSGNQKFDFRTLCNNFLERRAAAVPSTALALLIMMKSFCNISTAHMLCHRIYLQSIFCSTESAFSFLLLLAFTSYNNFNVEQLFVNIFHASTNSLSDGGVYALMLT